LGQSIGIDENNTFQFRFPNPSIEAFIVSETIRVYPITLGVNSIMGAQKLIIRETAIVQVKCFNCS